MKYRRSNILGGNICFATNKDVNNDNLWICGLHQAIYKILASEKDINQK